MIKTTDLCCEKYLFFPLFTHTSHLLLALLLLQRLVPLCSPFYLEMTPRNKKNHMFYRMEGGTDFQSSKSEIISQNDKCGIYLNYVQCLIKLGEIII